MKLRPFYSRLRNQSPPRTKSEACRLRPQAKSLRVRGLSGKMDERGWALLGMLLAVTVMSIMLIGIAPKVQMDVKRSKEEEMVYRGMQMAQGIARYYNAGRLSSLQLAVPPPYGYLYDLKKLNDGVQIGALQLKFVRQSALMDPMVSKDWVPVRARDPRIMPALQAYAAYNLVTIPQSYLILAAPPARTIVNLGSPTQPNGGDQGSGSSQGQGQTQGPVASPSGGNPSGGGFTTGGGFAGGQGAGFGQQPKPRPTPGQPDDDDDDDDDDATKGAPPDPLAHLLKDTEHGLPIIGVAPNLKGTAVHPLWGLTKYEEWVFIFVPLQPQVFQAAPTGGQPLQPGQRSNGGGINGGAGAGSSPIQPITPQR